MGQRRAMNDTITVNNESVYLTTTYQAGLATGTSIIFSNKLKADFELKSSFTSFIASGGYDFSDQLLIEFPFQREVPIS